MHSTVSKLLSFQPRQPNPTKQFELQQAKYIKKQAAYLMLSVSRAVQMHDYQTAKQILIYVADSCSCIREPDDEVKYLIEACCEHIAFVYKKQQINTLPLPQTLPKIPQNPPQSHQGILVMRYNKFSGQFQCDNQQKRNISQKVMLYLSKLNAILLSYQNISNQHSFIAMLTTYYNSFISVVLLIGLLFVVIFSNVSQILFGADHEHWILTRLPLLGVGVLFLIPLAVIYLRDPLIKDKAFFQHKLGQQIKLINEECQENGSGIKFYMPQGIEINVFVDNRGKRTMSRKLAKGHRQGKHQHSRLLDEEQVAVTNTKVCQTLKQFQSQQEQRGLM